MFWKKKEAAVKAVSYRCEVPGCGLDCTDEATLKRHTEWAHRAGTTPDTRRDTLNSGTQNIRV